MTIANTTFRIKKSLVSGNTPSSLANGEIAINLADGKLFYSKPDSSISYITNSESFSTISVDSSLILATSPTDILSIAAGDNISLTACTSSKTITISASNTGGGGGTSSSDKVYIFRKNTAPTSANTSDMWLNIDTGVMYENFGNTTSPVWAEFGPTNVFANTLPGVVSATTLLTQNNANVGSYLYANNGLYTSNNYTGSYTDGIVVDYVSGNGRISVGTNDGIVFYNGGVATNTLVSISSTGQLVTNYNPATTVNSALQITAANTRGGTGYADIFQLTNGSGNATNPNKYIRISPTGTIEILNSDYNAIRLDLSDTGDFSVAGNVSMSGVKAGYAPNRPAFRVSGSGTTNNLTTTQNGTGCLTANNWTVEFNQGTYLANTNGVFTAPVAGLYQVNIVGRNSGYASGISQLGVTKNGSGGGTIGGTCIMMIEFAASSTMNHAGASTVIKLAVGDTLACKILAGQINFDSNDNWSVAYIG